MREERQQKIIGELIEKAKKKLESIYCDRPDPRPWTSTVLEYDGSADMELIARLGTPAKGYIVVNWGRGCVLAFDPWDKLVLRQKVKGEQFAY